MTAAVSGFITVAAGCGLVGEEASAAKPARVPAAPFTEEAVAGEIAAYTRAAGLPEGDTSVKGVDDGAPKACVATWLGDVPADRAAEGFEGTVKRLRQHDWEIVSRHTEGVVTFRTLAKRGWKLYARHYASKDLGSTQIVMFTGVEDGCDLSAPVRDAYADPV
ncbi:MULTISPECIES: hypothetical protein [Streptomyces]|uniref:Lipoprotein n=2 Tax=Streptomyces TaxID=1883 RepID=A0ABU2RCT8_9ACTN|nr:MULTISPECIES: hypothetical protein [unclassified Streptomyces]MBK3593674.1 hypothetical protein [Streptomyces sp. MBT51]MDT0426691.1 hypothetical protein [Streptomyces sp. DSM 41770]